MLKDRAWRSLPASAIVVTSVDQPSSYLLLWFTELQILCIRTRKFVPLPLICPRFQNPLLSLSISNGATCSASPHEPTAKKVSPSDPTTSPIKIGRPCGKSRGAYSAKLIDLIKDLNSNLSFKYLNGARFSRSPAVIATRAHSMKAATGLG